MTDRHVGYIVTLDESLREDDDAALEALRMIRGVASVRPLIDNADIHVEH